MNVYWHVIQNYLLEMKWYIIIILTWSRGAEKVQSYLETRVWYKIKEQ